MNKTNLPDQELWAEVTAGNSSAYAELYARYWKKLFKTANHYLKDTSSAEEIVHDVFVVLWNRREFLKIENFESYIRVTARYHVFKKLKAAKVSPIDYIEEYTETGGSTGFAASTEKLLQEDFETELKGYLQGLPKRCAEIFMLSRVKHLDNNEIAGLLGISKASVENQITSALKHLRGRIRGRSINL